MNRSPRKEWSEMLGLSMTRKTLAALWSSGRMLVAILVLGSMLGCVGTEELAPDDLNGEIQFNDRLRPDIGPVAGVSEPQFFSDGGEGEDEIITPLYHSMIPIADLRQLHRSEHLWVEDDGYPILSYEAVNADFSYPDAAPLNTTRIGTCGYGTDPETRAQVGFNCDSNGKNCNYGQWSGGLPSSEELGITVGLTSHTVRTPDPDPAQEARIREYNLVVPLDLPDTVTDVDQLGCYAPHAHGNSISPYCVIQCGLPAARSDTTYTLQAVDPKMLQDINQTYPALRSPLHTVTPHLKVVSGSRALARPLTFLERLDITELDTRYQSYYWRWAVPDLPNGHWEENFSPNLMVSNVRIFIERGYNPDIGIPNRQYLAPYRLVIDHKKCGREADPEVGIIFGAGNCPELVTPTYHHRAISNKLGWLVEFRVWADAMGQITEEPPVKAGDPVYIEFEVVDATIGSRGSALRVSPPAVDLGEVTMSSKPVLFERIFTVSSVGVASATVERLWMEGRDATDFSVSVPTTGSLPFALRPLQAFALTLEANLEANASPFGVKNATVVVQARDAAGQVIQVRGSIVLTAVDAILEVFPEYLPLVRDSTRQQATVEYQKHVIVANYGYVDLDRGTIILTGSHASAFTVLGSDYYPGSVYALPPASNTIPSGGHEQLTVVYHPSSAGTHRAQIRITSNAGEKIIELAGQCFVGSCAYPRPR
jgi:hypothetical protein